MNNKFSYGTTEVTLSQICDNDKVLNHIASYPKRWKVAFDFLENAGLRPGSIECGTYDLLPDAEVYAIVQEYLPKDADSCRFEAHHRYIDLQYVPVGTEKMGIAPPDVMKVSVPYVDDIEFYQAADVQGAEYDTTSPSKYFVFFPDDPHRPSMKNAEGSGKGTVRKIVIKIKN